jgi:FlaA1/EpsC-like NDP-sugar epimerase
LGEGRVSVSQIHKVEINDLLGREAVHLDEAAVGRFLHGRRILITGAGGSIGSEMCRQVCRWQPAQLILLEQAENSLFEIHSELRRDFPPVDVATVLCDVYDRQRVMEVFSSLRPDVVIHAAAHKHVPLMELNPCEAVKNNILGTQNVADACRGSGVGEFVLISTDKAVNPSSIMGCTKRAAEIYVQGLNGSPGCRTQFKTVRFGNVLGSAGSVVPIFERQIRQGGPVTVTDPEMKRYFMTISEASQLVLQAAATGEGGQIFLLDMGGPVKIVDLARDMITLSGLRVGEDIDVVYTGARPGEKLFEELRIEGEDVAPTTHPKVKIWRHQAVEASKIQQAMAQFDEVAHSPDRERIVAALQFLVPEFAPLDLSKDEARRAQAEAELQAAAKARAERLAASLERPLAAERPVWRLLLAVPLCLCAEIACVTVVRSGGVSVMNENTWHIGGVAVFSAVSASLMRRCFSAR